MYELLLALAQPFPLLLAGLAGWLWKVRPALTGNTRIAWRAGAALVVLLWLWSLPLTARLTTGWLESRHVRHFERPADVRAIVVLGGSLVAGPPGWPPQLETGSLRRVMRAAELYHAGPSCPVLVTGGKTQAADVPAEADLLAATLVQLNVRRSDIIMEDRALNTAQNARFSAELLRARGLTDRILLVSSATHLYRAELLFRAQGIGTIPMGCEYRTDEIDRGWGLLWPKSFAVRCNQEVLHEVLGLAKCWWRGELTAITPPTETRP
jgi:uncharacterized SAM-binding protein YcdF (DUF218 family)